jgi:hypothetical protein
LVTGLPTAPGKQPNIGQRKERVQRGSAHQAQAP